MTNYAPHQCGIYCSDTEHAFMVYTEDDPSERVLLADLNSVGFPAIRARRAPEAQIPSERPHGYRSMRANTWRAHFAWVAWVKAEDVGGYA